MKLLLAATFPVFLGIGVVSLSAAEISPDDKRIQYSDTARVSIRSGAAHFSRPVQSAYGFDSNNPGARIRFITDATEIVAHLFYTDEHQYSSRNSVGLVLRDGKQVAQFQPAKAPGTHDVIIRGDYKSHLIELVLPYADSVSFRGLTASEGASFTPPARRATRRYVAYGDSITHGFYAESVSHSYSFQVGEKLGCEAVNLGFGGRALTPSDGDAIAQCRGDVISILMGYNDCDARKPLANYHADLAGLLGNIRRLQPKTPILLITPLSSTDSKNGPALEDYRKVIRAMVTNSKDPNLHLVEGTALLDARPALLSDGVHPNNEGFTQIGDRLAARIRPLLNFVPR